MVGPYAARLYSISDPLEEEKALTANGPIVLNDDDDPEDSPKLEVVDGGAVK